jgi:hypothetical protein
MTRIEALRRRIRILTCLFIVGLVLSGVTAIPLERELDWLIRSLGAEPMVQAPASTAPPDWAVWLLRVREALRDTNAKYPFVAYGFDWLAFGHFLIAIAFVGALRDPVRNIWLFQFGMIACVLVVPYAFVFGGLRGIPIPWRLIDCSFGVFGFVPLWICKRSAAELAENQTSDGTPQVTSAKSMPSPQ